MKILITGAAGFVGSHLAEAFIDRGCEVVGVDSLDPYYSPELKKDTYRKLESKGVHMVEADLVTADLKPLLMDVGGVIHLAAQPGNTEGMSLEQYARNNLFATQQLLLACEASAQSLRYFINVATSSVYGLYATESEEAAPQPVSYYGVTKLAAEQLVLARYRDKGFPACSLRLFSVYGERERPDKLYPKLIKAICTDTAFPLFEGSESHQRSYTYIGDIVQGVLDVVDNWDKAKGEIFNIGTDQLSTTAEGIATVEEIMGQKVKIKNLPKRPGDQLSTHANIDKARRVLGYNPRTTLKEGLERMVRWYQTEIDGKVDY